MNVLLTGAFGNLGRCILEEISTRGHSITVLELSTDKNRKTYKQVKQHINKMIWGDLTVKSDITEALKGVDSVIHLAAVIPPLSELKKELCNRVNVDGTQNILDGIQETGRRVSLVHASSSSVMGNTQKQDFPVTVDQEPKPFGNYAISKRKSEKLVLNSSIPSCITRFGGVLTTKTTYSMDMIVHGFEFPYNGRYEVILDIDLAVAVTNAAEILFQGNDIDKKIFFIGGGRDNGCQIYHHEIYDRLFNALGLIAPKKAAYANHKPCMVDWLDTDESQLYLQYQKHHFDDFINLIADKVKFYSPFMKLFRRPLSKMLENRSPYLK